MLSLFSCFQARPKRLIIPAKLQLAAYDALRAAKRGENAFPYRQALHLSYLIWERLEGLPRRCREQTLYTQSLLMEMRWLTLPEAGSFTSWSSRGYGSFLVVFEQSRTCERHFDGTHAMKLEYSQAFTETALDQARSQAVSRLPERVRQTIWTRWPLVPPFRTEHYEARSWLTEKGSAACFATNAFRTKTSALAYVEGLYRFGVAQVCVTHVFDRLCDILLTGRPCTDTPAVELPDDAEHAQALREFCERLLPVSTGRSHARHLVLGRHDSSWLDRYSMELNVRA